MPSSRRHVLAAAGLGIAGFDAGGTGQLPLGQTSSTTQKEVADLVTQSFEANAALMRGDIDRYKALVTLSHDFTLMAPFGGTPTHAKDISPATMEAMGRFFRNGTLEQEVVHTYASADMVVLAVIERARVEVGGLPLQPWALRVTLVYRRDAGAWRLVHRHADPLVAGIGLKQAAALGRGERSEV